MATSARHNQTDRGLRKGHSELRAAHPAERILLVGADRDAFLAAVMAPPEPNEKLVEALKRHRDLCRMPGDEVAGL